MIGKIGRRVIVNDQVNQTTLENGFSFSWLQMLLKMSIGNKMTYFLQLLLAAIGSLSIVIEAAPAYESKRAGCNAANGKAIYFLTNNQQNAVVALPIAADGTLSNGTVTETSGMGSNSIDGSTNSSAGPDALVGQAAVTVAGQVRQRRRGHFIS